MGVLSATGERDRGAVRRQLSAGPRLDVAVRVVAPTGKLGQVHAGAKGLERVGTRGSGSDFRWGGPWSQAVGATPELDRDLPWNLSGSSVGPFWQMPGGAPMLLVESNQVESNQEQAAVELHVGLLACPWCGGELRPLGYGPWRVLGQRVGGRIPLQVRRERCRASRVAHTLLPQVSLPWGLGGPAPSCDLFRVTGLPTREYNGAVMTGRDLG